MVFVFYFFFSFWAQALKSSSLQLVFFLAAFSPLSKRHLDRNHAGMRTNKRGCKRSQIAPHLYFPAFPLVFQRHFHTNEKHNSLGAQCQPRPWLLTLLTTNMQRVMLLPHEGRIEMNLRWLICFLAANHIIEGEQLCQSRRSRRKMARRVEGLGTQISLSPTSCLRVVGVKPWPRICGE